MIRHNLYVPIPICPHPDRPIPFPTRKPHKALIHMGLLHKSVPALPSSAIDHQHRPELLCPQKPRKHFIEYRTYPCKQGAYSVVVRR
jgi:hypothetical protein